MRKNSFSLITRIAQRIVMLAHSAVSSGRRTARPASPSDSGRARSSLARMTKAGLSRFWKYTKSFFLLLIAFCVFFFDYLKKKVILVSLFFEKQKNVAVRFFIMKRGRYNRPFLHISAMAVLGIGLVIGPFLADTYPIFSQNGGLLAAKISSAQAQEQSIFLENTVFETQISQKPRSEILIYQIEKGDTVSTIAQKFGISSDTIRWANNLTSDDITVGDELKILPVTGISHKVSKGDSVYTIAKKYDTNAQAIVDFPFNDFANPQTFSLVEGQILIVPEGVKPSEKPTIRPRYIAAGPMTIFSSGFAWPLSGGISQFFAWYHPGIDITAPVGTPFVSAESGKVREVYTSGWNGGYGTYVIIAGNDGTSTVYAHMMGVNVAVGDSVSAGKTTLGWVGMTGRTTGSHLHFEVHGSGGSINPLAVLGGGKREEE